MKENINNILSLEEEILLTQHIIKQNNELEKNKIKEEYGCENSTLLDFDPRYEHIEKSEYKGKICYIVVENN